MDNIEASDELGKPSCRLGESQGLAMLKELDLFNRVLGEEQSEIAARTRNRYVVPQFSLRARKVYCCMDVSIQTLGVIQHM